MNLAEHNKNLVLNGFTRFAAGDTEVLRTLLHKDFIEHSPGNPSGRDAFIEFITSSPVANAHLDLKRVIADNDHVVLHYLMTPPGNDQGIAVIDIWKLVNGQITEHWDVVQPVPDLAETPNGML
ncbi:nuclear transport factor 2 family protein [Actinocorallia sp. API 0066]|uniref:nuclear transport factor 2 family protein n=1 Tax=Actinocorallia sp. API 0066 TaxID=2896846 RepID=UPI001E4430B1|nr:nuclear transport factor 2 family protein [Actinocorallia sp. API 0066]MCD0449378.1 nuclear transport factor 2 family protein [Actinocorallia sp. API 0066]